MPQIERWENLPGGIRQYLIDRMRDRAISIADLNQLRIENLKRRWVTGIRISARLSFVA
jgi:hypothetical protein